MKRITRLFFFMFLVFQQAVLAQSANTPVHDPVMIKQDSMYYLFCTGRGISMSSMSCFNFIWCDVFMYDKLPGIYTI